MPYTSTNANLLPLSTEPRPEARFREEYYQTRTSTRKVKLPARASIGVDPLLLERMWARLAQFRPLT
jgi:hypothetical protein